MAMGSSGAAAENAAAVLLRLQMEQDAHDERYHREISRLSVQDRLRHMTLHFAKYAGQLAACDEEAGTVSRLVTDVLIISFSTANILDVDLGKQFGKTASTASDLLELGRRLSSDSGKVALTYSDFLRNLSIAAGKLAAAAEKLDHLEEFPFRATFRDGVQSIAVSALQFLAAKNWDAMSLVPARLASVRQKRSLSGKL